MKLSIARDELLRLLQQTTPVVERRQTLPVLANVLFEVTSEQLIVAATDQEVEVRAITREFTCLEEGEITIPGRKLLDIIRHLPTDGDVEVALIDNRVSVGSGAFSSFLATLPPIEFPSIEAQPASVVLRVPARDMETVLGRTAFAMASQDVRYFFNGSLFEVEDGRLRVVATNGQRLAVSEVAATVQEGAGRSCIVPRKAILELDRLLSQVEGELEIQISENHVRMVSGQLSLATLLIDASYPDYRAAIPGAGNRLLKIDRQRLREALVRSAILSNEIYKNVKLGLSAGALQISTNNPLQEEAHEQLACVLEGEPLEIAFNVVYLTETLGVMGGEEVHLAFTDANSACMLTNPEDHSSRYVISPMML